MRRSVRLWTVVVVALTGCSSTIVSAEPDAGPRLVFADEFDGPARKPDAPWQAVTGGGGWGNDERQVYTDSIRNSRVDGRGHLAITVRRHPRGYTSARLTTKDNWRITHGRISARIAVPAGTGLHPAFWMLGDDIDRAGYPESGEIDIIETVNHAPEYHVGVHVPSSEPAGRQSISASGRFPTPLAGRFHTYWVDKSPDRIELGIDSETMLVVEPKDLAPGARWVFEKPFHLLLNVAVGGRWPGPTDGTTPARATMLVDWVRAHAP